MPELPEVETIVRGLRACLPGRRIRRAIVTHPAILCTAASRFIALLEGAKVKDVSRHGKHILLRMAQRETNDPFWWVVHLGMTGRFTCEPLGAGPQPHTHACFELSGKGRLALRYTDIRRFGRMEVAWTNGTGALPPRLQRLGPEPLEISEAEFVRRLRARNTRVKALLLDQKFLRGLGNIYADESLHRAGLRPGLPARRISRARAAALWHSIRSVLEEAITHGGSSVSDYVDAAGRRGEFQRLHRVYGRAGEECLSCGARLRCVRIAGRSATFCPRCQRS